MKKVKMVLMIVLGILYGSFAYADCPSPNDIYLNKDGHLAAPGLGGTWVEQNIWSGDLPTKQTVLSYAISKPNPNYPDIINNLICYYFDESTQRPFALLAPSQDMNFRIKTVGHWWCMEDVLCTCDQPTTLADCPFILP
ncbi:MAG: hypothetical protein K0R49_1232 [Burkholderiales bacterium]|jgi:hypothetical protein|nr:hypothetical protein [Burkholderiales bacterium]MCE3268980.1 hypothetical protein [Burkholderiales bacterium]